MQQDNNHIENKLRQLENQQLPDLSQMDAHWQQMEAVLSPGVSIPRKRYFYTRRFKKIVIAASIAAVLLIVFFKYNTTGNTKTKIVTNDKAGAPGASNTRPAILLTDSSVRSSSAIVKQKNIYPSAAGWQKADLLKAVDTTVKIDKDTTAVTEPGSIASVATDQPMSLDNFYEKINRPAQEFILDASTGGNIACQQGATFIIPATAFVDESGNSITGRIKIEVEEFYKYSDIVAANLTTMSDGKQLVTGGMIKIAALQNGHAITLRPDKAIKLTMPAVNYDPAMQLFTADNETNKMAGKYNMDTTLSSAVYRKINWQLTGPQFSIDKFDQKTNFMNMQDDPADVRGRDGRIGIFKVTSASPYTAEEAKKILQERYGDYYRKIKVKKVNENRRIFNPIVGRIGVWRVIKPTIGDSVRLTVDEALKEKYITKNDSAFYAAKVTRDSLKFASQLRIRNNSTNMVWVFDTQNGTLNKDSILKLYSEQLRINGMYSFEIKKMGWINCDRFSSYRDKIDFAVSLPDSTKADKFVTQLVFTNIRSVMPGEFYQNKITFANIPANMPVYIVGLGERNGKVVSFMQLLKTSAAEVSIHKLDETTPEAFKEKLRQLDL